MCHLHDSPLGLRAFRLTFLLVGLGLIGCGVAKNEGPAPHADPRQAREDEANKPGDQKPEVDRVGQPSFRPNPLVTGVRPAGTLTSEPSNDNSTSAVPGVLGQPGTRPPEDVTVPILSRIPYSDRLFQNTSKTLAPQPPQAQFVP